MTRVFVADDHTVVRTGIKILVNTDPEMSVVGEASDGHSALEALEVTPCDVLLLDLSLPRLSGVEVLRRVRERFPRIQVLVLSMYPEEQYALRMVRAGAAGYLSKDRSEHELVEAIRHVAQGRTYVSPAVAEMAVRGSEPPSGHAALSGREHQIFLLVANGSTVSDIAAELNLSASTVSNYLVRIKTKLGVRTLGDIVSYGHRAGLVG